ncbi:MAG TPA: SPOR domain-containing protein [Gemmatimonadaceae bacterium]|nr:SPOR domain-containing protein [Gemmatimonadaceae bacterium]
MRRALVLATVVMAAACGDPRGLVPVSAAGSGSQSGPDALVLRVPMAGGAPRVYSYTHLDSVVWTASSRAPGVDRMLAFDRNAGALLFVDSKGNPVRLDLRLGGSDQVTSDTVRDARSADGSAVYAIGATGKVVRYTTGQSWTYTPPAPARAVFPQDDGSLLVVGDTGRRTRVWRLFPPEPKIVKSADFPSAWRTLPAQAGERLYVIVDSGLVGLSTRTLEWTHPVKFPERIAAAVPTPSGDRVFVVTDSSPILRVVDRYTAAISAQIKLPGQASELRIDPLGRYLLAREAGRDSAWVISVGTNRVLGTVGTEWRADLPFVGPDGAIALLHRRSVTFIDGETLRPARAVSTGARDFWYQFQWNGFRPRASSLDRPVSFNLAAADSVRTAADAAAADSAARAAQLPDSLAALAGRVAAHDSVVAPVGYIVSFAALLSVERAQQLASEIMVEGQRARILATTRNGTSIYRVVLGPYPTRDEAERVGRASQHTYWVYEATP